ncbi:AraC family transcriptional regulator [Alcanivorax balearicus MACL04]|uniref:AraC family transcriptional regulator n=1 Tax=Alloalcanivorax balearicus MACL04 TaxID=1177182 RepID=A0ABT2QZ96_9GAMM|nr:AraC family transcriptional regulator [Alloalcanivorax balearicus]MCU5782853.1 AraC family transcriptional regulator [Alloalcanivorax balearicus MACL04]
MIDQSSEPQSDLSHSSNADLISELLAGMRLRGLRYHRLRLTPPFGVRFGEGGRPRAHFHFVAQGRAYLRGEDGDLNELSHGTAVLMPRDGPHALLSEPALPCRHITGFDAAALCDAVDDVQSCDPDTCRSQDTLIFSGCMELDLGSLHPLVSLMPAVMRVDPQADRQSELLPILEAMEQEVCGQRAGFAGILTRLAEVVAAAIIRSWVECGCGDASGWVEALRDPRLGRVIAALHREPGRHWTVESMAKEMGVSRSVFAERFLTVTGITPLRYVTELRMRLASQWLTRERLPVEDVAERLGYGSQAAFSRAFKRTTGHSPGAYRATTAHPSEEH